MSAGVVTGMSGAGGSEAILEEIKSILTELIGTDFVEIVGIRRDSAFLTDLEMDSIKIVAFIEQLKNHFSVKGSDGQDLIVEWFSKQPLRKLRKLTVGDIVDLLVEAQV